MEQTLGSPVTEKEKAKQFAKYETSIGSTKYGPKPHVVSALFDPHGAWRSRDSRSHLHPQGAPVHMLPHPGGLLEFLIQKQLCLPLCLTTLYFCLFCVVSTQVLIANVVSLLRVGGLM